MTNSQLRAFCRNYIRERLLFLESDPVSPPFTVSLISLSIRGISYSIFALLMFIDKELIEIRLRF